MLVYKSVFSKQHVSKQIHNSTWFGSSHYSSVGLQHSIVDDFLIFTELPIGREGAGDVRSVATIFPSHVKQAHVTISYYSVIRSTSMSIM